MAMNFEKLVAADIYRDGGSFEAVFVRADGTKTGLFLQCSASPDKRGLHHRFLYVFDGDSCPDGCYPVVTGSAQEQELYRATEHFLASATAPKVPFSGAQSFEKLREMYHWMVRREPCFPPDLESGRYRGPRNSR